MRSSTPRPRPSASTGSGRAGGRHAGPEARLRPGAAPALEALDAIDAAADEVRSELTSAASGVEGAGPFVAAVLGALARQRAERAGLRRRLGLVPSRPPAAPEEREPDLRALRDALDALVYACADAIPELDPEGVAILVDHLRTQSAHCAVVELWLERELAR